jgi:hypothetical protein
MANARALIALSDNEIVERFTRLGYRVSIEQIAFTGEVIENFREASEQIWWKSGAVRRDEPGLLLIEDAQPQPTQRTRDIVVISFGGARAVMGVDIKPGAALPLPDDVARRWAPNMEWQAEPAKALAALTRKWRALSSEDLFEE